MSIDRRAFLKGASAVAVVAALPAPTFKLLGWDLASGPNKTVGYLQSVIDEYGSHTIRVIDVGEWDARKLSRYRDLAYYFDIEGQDISTERIAAAAPEPWPLARLSQEAGRTDRGNERIGRLALEGNLSSQSTSNGL